MTDWTERVSFSRHFWVGCAAVLLSVSFIVVMVLQSADARRLAASNTIITATVIDQTEIRRRPDQTEVSYVLEYQFEFANQQVTYRRTVPEPFFWAHPAGTTWPIRVHTKDADLHDLYDGETRNSTWGFLAFAALLAAVGARLALSNGNFSALRSRLAQDSNKI